MKLNKPMTLRWKINLLVFLNITFVLLLVVTAFSYIIIDRKFVETSDRALFLARTIASLPQVEDAFQAQKPSELLQPLAAKLQKNTQAEFIVIANMNLIRYSHPNPQKIGKPLDGEDSFYDNKVLQGQEIQATAVGSLGLTVRAKTPIYDSNHQQIGLVSVGFLAEDVWNRVYSVMIKVIGIGIGALVFGLCGAYLLSGHIKKQIFNMEPNEIAYLSQQQSAILDSIREGIIAVNNKGEITTCNMEAKKILGMENMDLQGKNIASILPTSRLMEVFQEGIIQRDEPMIIGNTLVITNRVPVYVNGKEIGAVSSFRDKLQLDKIDKHLADIGQFVDSLRSQRHEFMNKLHLISGLIKLKEYDMVNELIGQVNEEQQGVLNFFLSRIHDPAVVGVLVGKVHQAKELNIQLTIDSESVIPDPCPHREIVITLLGNAIENSLEAISRNHAVSVDRKIEVIFRNESDCLSISVLDTGPGIDARLGDDIFRDGVTTKGAGRGFGLALLSRLVSNIGGDLSIVSTPAGATLKANLPINGGVKP